jgi:6-pyruvoyltetrahydropterin/6-carboxytetrahydropterin synthase
MMKVFIEDRFDAAHWLPNVPLGHKCRNLHGHTYHIRLEIEGIIGEESGWVIDYVEIRAQWEQVKVQIDHRLLNEIPSLINSTCEHLAQWVWGKLKPTLPGLALIEIRETQNCGVVYKGDA